MRGHKYFSYKPLSSTCLSKFIKADFIENISLCLYIKRSTPLCYFCLFIKSLHNMFIIFLWKNVFFFEGHFYLVYFFLLKFNFISDMVFLWMKLVAFR